MIRPSIAARHSSLWSDGEDKPKRSQQGVLRAIEMGRANGAQVIITDFDGRQRGLNSSGRLRFPAAGWRMLPAERDSSRSLYLLSMKRYFQEARSQQLKMNTQPGYVVSYHPARISTPMVVPHRLKITRPSKEGPAGLDAPQDTSLRSSRLRIYFPSARISMIRLFLKMSGIPVVNSFVVLGISLPISAQPQKIRKTPPKYKAKVFSRNAACYKRPAA